MSTENEKQRIYFELMLEGTRGKFSVLLYISSLTAALLVIGSLGALFPLSNLVRSIISILLILMVYSLEVYLSEVTKLTSDAAKELFGGGKYPVLNFCETIKFLFTGYEKGRKDEKKFRDRLHSVFPHLALGILGIVVFVLVILIWWTELSSVWGPWLSN